MSTQRTQVAIIGGGPSGMLLAQLLDRQGIDSVVLERRSRAHVLGRIRAGVLERGMRALMEEAGVAQRMRTEGLTHSGVLLGHGDQRFRIDLEELTGHRVTVYGQTELTRDLYDARGARGGAVIHDVSDVTIGDIRSDAPEVTYHVDGQPHRLACDFIAGCDGFHGVSRHAIPEASRQEFEKTYPFAWLGLLSDTPPVDAELLYTSSARGFALCSMRSAARSRYYLQCPVTERAQDWSDSAFWEELAHRLPADMARNLVTGPSIEKSVAPLRSFVCEPMQWGNLFLCGDAAHIVPPTGAKGLNTAASDVRYLYDGLRQFYKTGDRGGLDGYSAKALARVWKVERFSWWFSSLMHHFPDQSEFDQRMQMAEFEFLRSNRAAQEALALNYVGLPY